MDLLYARYVRGNAPEKHRNKLKMKFKVSFTLSKSDICATALLPYLRIQDMLGVLAETKTANKLPM